MSDDFMGEDFETALTAGQQGSANYFDGGVPGDPTGNYARQERDAMAEGNYYGDNQAMHYRAANVIVPDRTQIDRPGAEGFASEEVGDNVLSRAVTRFKRKHAKDDQDVINRANARAVRTAKKKLLTNRRNTRAERLAYFRARAKRRVTLGPVEQAKDLNEQAQDVEEDARLWISRRGVLKQHSGIVTSGDKTLGYGWVDDYFNPETNAGAPISTITFSMAGMLPEDKVFMDRAAYYRVNHTLMEHSDKEIEQQKLDAMHFFDEHYGLNFQSNAKPIKGEEDDGSLQIPGLATLRRYAISPSLQTRSTTAVSEDHPIELHEKVHEAGWIATITAKRGANLGGIFGGDKGKAVKPGTSMSCGYWVFINPKFQNDHAIIHFESSEPSFFGGASGHVAHHYQIHDLSVIDGIHITKGAFGTATSITTERKILGNKKKLGDLYGATAASVQTTINLTHF